MDVAGRDRDVIANLSWTGSDVDPKQETICSLPEPYDEVRCSQPLPGSFTESESPLLEPRQVPFGWAAREAAHGGSLAPDKNTTALQPDALTNANSHPMNPSASMRSTNSPQETVCFLP
jgi:hypothetical protein